MARHPVMAEIVLASGSLANGGHGGGRSSLRLSVFLATVLLLPGVLQGYASTYRLPREISSRLWQKNCGAISDY